MRSILLRRALTLLSLVFITAPLPVYAAGDKDADRLIEQGVDLRSSGKDEEALALFEKARAIKETPRVLAQIGLAEQALGRWVEAEAHLEAALATKGDTWIEKNRRALDQAVTKVRVRLGSLDIVGKVRGAEVRINGRLAGTLPLEKPARVVAGSVVVEVTAPGHWPLSRTVEVSAGGMVRESMDLVAKPAASTPPLAVDPTPPPSGPQTPPVARTPPPGSEPKAAPPPPPSPTTATSEAKTGGGGVRAILPWAAAGGAVVGLGVGIVGLVIRSGNIADYNDDTVCLAGGRTRDENCKDKLDAANTAGTLATVGFIAAGVFAAGAVVLFLTAPSSGEAQALIDFESGAQIAGLGVGPGDLGLGFQQRF